MCIDLVYNSNRLIKWRVFMSAEYLQHLSEVMSVGQEINGRALQAQQYAVHPAAYDPAFLLPFTLQVKLHTIDLISLEVAIFLGFSLFI